MGAIVPISAAAAAGLAKALPRSPAGRIASRSSPAYNATCMRSRRNRDSSSALRTVRSSRRALMAYSETPRHRARVRRASQRTAKPCCSSVAEDARTLPPPLRCRKPLRRRQRRDGSNPRNRRSRTARRRAMRTTQATLSKPPGKAFPWRARFLRGTRLSRAPRAYAAARPRSLRSATALRKSRRRVANRRGRARDALSAVHEQTDEQTDRHRDADHLPRIVVDILVGGASGGFGAVDCVILHVQQLDSGIAQFCFNLCPKIGGLFSRFFGGLFEQRVGFVENVGEIFHQRFAAALE